MTPIVSPNAQSAELGLLRYEERRHITPAVTYTCLGLVFLVTGVLCALIPSAPPAPPQASLVGGGIVAVGGLLCLVIGLLRLIPNLRASWHLHEHGVRVVQRGREQVLRYDEVEELTHHFVRVFFHGVCTGEVHEVAFRSNASGPRTIRLKQVRRPASVSGADLDRPGELQQACDTVAGFLAARMLVRLAKGEPVPWVRELRLVAGGLDPGASGGQIAWEQLERLAIDKGTLRVWRRGEAPPVLTVPTKLPNFWPGYRVLVERTGLSPEA